MRYHSLALDIRRVAHLLMFLLLMSNYCFGQERDSTSRYNPELRFLEERIIDYGHIKAKDQITINVQFENADRPQSIVRIDYYVEN